jgi:hypothetical protein
MSRAKTIAVIKRVSIEFGLPVALAIVWMMVDVGRDGKTAEYVKQFGVAFFMASWVWGQLLRIIYQNSQRDRLAEFGQKLEEVSGAMHQVQVIAGNMLGKATPETETDIRHLVSAVGSVERDLIDARDAYRELEIREARRRLGADLSNEEARRVKDLTGPM